MSLKVAHKLNALRAMREAQYEPETKPKKYVSVDVLKKAVTKVAKSKPKKARATARKRKSKKPAARGRGRPKLPPAALSRRLGPSEKGLYDLLCRMGVTRAEICDKFGWTDDTARGAIARLSGKMADWSPPGAIGKWRSPGGMIYKVDA